MKKKVSLDNLCSCGKSGKLKFDEKDDPAGIWCEPCWKKRHLLIVKNELLKDLTKKLRSLYDILDNIENDAQRLTSGNTSHVKGSILHLTRSAKVIVNTFLNKK